MTTGKRKGKGKAAEGDRKALERRILELEAAVSRFRFLEAELKRHAALEELLLDISTKFINIPPEEVDRGINEALEAIALFTDVDRSYVILLSPDGKRMDNTHEWCAPGVEPQIDNLKDLDAGVFPWWMERIRNLEDIHIPRVADLPPEAAAEKEILEAQDIQSLVVVPMILFGEAIGFLGFDSVRSEKRWPRKTVRLLRMTGNIIAQALERRRVEEALRKNEERLWLASLGAEAAVWDWNVRTGEMVFNRQWARILGQEVEEIEGHVRSWVKRIHPDDIRRVMKRLNSHLKGEISFYESEYRLRTKEGNWVWVLDRGRVMERDAGGKPLRMAGAHLDITERKLMETALALSEMRYRDIIEGQTELICRFLPDLTLTFVNEAYCRYFGRKPEELLGKSFLLLVPEEEHGKVRKHLQSFGPENPMSFQEHSVTDGKGRVRRQQWTNRAIFDEEGEIIEFQAVGREIPLDG